MNPSSIKTHTLIEPCNPNQKAFVKSIKNRNNVITIGLGCPGTGKTLLAIQTAILLYNNPNYDIDKILYVRPNVRIEDEQETGTLPGGQIEKLWHLCYPLLDNLPQIISKADTKYLLENEIIEISNVADLRGRSLSNCVVIMDEAQNSTYKGLKTALTRIGENCKFVMIGDPDQCDLKSKFFIPSSVYIEEKVEDDFYDEYEDDEDYDEEDDYGYVYTDYDRYDKTKSYLKEIDNDNTGIGVQTLSSKSIVKTNSENKTSIVTYYKPIEVVVQKIQHKEKVKVVRFTKSDILRSSVVQDIIDCL